MSHLYFGDFFVKDKNNYIYAVDMLRVSCDITNQIFEDKILSHLRPYMHNDKDNFPRLESYQGFGFSGFKYTYVLRLSPDVSFYIGFMSNQELINENKSLRNPFTKFNLTLEFNPNKVLDYSLLINILKHNWGWKILSVDLCCDIPFKANDVKLLYNPKNLLKIFEKNGIKTFELGVGNNRIKIYNKTYESSLDYDLTRIEFSVRLDLNLKDALNHDFNFKVPGLSVEEYQVHFNDLKLDKTLQCVLWSVEHGYDINNLTRYYKKKVLDYEMKKSPIEFDLGCFNKTFINYLNYYFSNLVI